MAWNSQKIREGDVNPLVPIVFMTAFSAQTRVKQARDCGVTEFLRKPFTADSLYKRIEEIIERPRKFVKTTGYFGSDRRRKSVGGYKGPDKRAQTPIDIDFVEKKTDKE